MLCLHSLPFLAPTESQVFSLVPSTAFSGVAYDQSLQIRLYLLIHTSSFMSSYSLMANLFSLGLFPLLVWVCLCVCRCVCVCVDVFVCMHVRIYRGQKKVSGPWSCKPLDVGSGNSTPGSYKSPLSSPNWLIFIIE